MKCNEQSDTAGAIAFLQLSRNFARSPRRHMTPGVYLIGSGRDCRIRLGDEALPERHSRLWISPADAVVETLGRDLHVIVNGSAARRARLFDGDLLEIGSVRLVFRRMADTTAQPEFTAQQELEVRISQSDRIPSRPSDRSAHRTAGEMTAEELVDSIAATMKMVEDLERTQATALGELLAAASAAGRSSAPAAEDALSTPSSLTLLRFDDCLKRIESLETVIEEVVRQQSVMAEMLQTATHQVAGQIMPPGHGGHRASA